MEVVHVDTSDDDAGPPPPRSRGSTLVGKSVADPPPQTVPSIQHPTSFRGGSGGNQGSSREAAAVAKALASPPSLDDPRLAAAATAGTATPSDHGSAASAGQHGQPLARRASASSSNRGLPPPGSFGRTPYAAAATGPSPPPTRSPAAADHQRSAGGSPPPPRENTGHVDDADFGATFRTVASADGGPPSLPQQQQQQQPAAAASSRSSSLHPQFHGAAEAGALLAESREIIQLLTREVVRLREQKCEYELRLRDEEQIGHRTRIAELDESHMKRMGAKATPLPSLDDGGELDRDVLVQRLREQRARNVDMDRRLRRAEKENERLRVELKEQIGHRQEDLAAIQRVADHSTSLAARLDEVKAELAASKSREAAVRRRANEATQQVRDAMKDTIESLERALHEALEHNRVLEAEVALNRARQDRGGGAAVDSPAS